MAELTNEQIAEGLRLCDERRHDEFVVGRRAVVEAALRELLAARETIKRLEGMEAKWRAEARGHMNCTPSPWKDNRLSEAKALTQAADELRSAVTPESERT